ncbi:hypothetical protein [Cecembia sp.]|uniref:hypothetical protein n=1 Tax=Cecembia sp. TaxID=1898110 RepID=UPI0025C21E08|nr:hypothetical protein [Cecembia sp.]
MDFQILDDEWTVSFFNFLKSKGLDFTYFPKKRKIKFLNDLDEPLFSIRLSTQLKFDIQKNELALEEFSNYLLILIRSGIGSVGFVQNRDLLHHKVFRAYMVRKKQGKSQVKYLKTKGKSRAGSRIRLHATLEFFQDITKRVNQHLENYAVDQIGLSCSETLIPYLFGENESLNLNKKDPRIFKIPKHVGSPTLEMLYSVKEFVEKNELFIMEQGKYLFQSFMDGKNIQSDEEDSEDW